MGGPQRGMTLVMVFFRLRRTPLTHMCREVMRIQ